MACGWVVGAEGFQGVFEVGPTVDERNPAPSHIPYVQ